MKAKVKETGMMVDVHQYGFPDTDLWKCDDENMVFHKSALIFMGDIIDWEQRRYEIAKDMLAAIESNSNPQMFEGQYEEQVEWALRFADELIKQLKEKNNE